MVRFTRAKYYKSCGPLCRPTPACTYCINEPGSHLVITIVSPNLHPVLSYLAHTLLSVCTPRKLFQYLTRRISWFFDNFLLRHPPKFPSFSHIATLRAYVQPQMTTNIPEPLNITQKLILTVKRIKEYQCKVLYEKIHGSTEWYIALHRFTHNEGVQSTSPPPSSQPPPAPQTMQIGQNNAYQVGALKQG